MGNGKGTPNGGQNNAGKEGGAAAAGGFDEAKLNALVESVSTMSESIGQLSSGLKSLSTRVDQGALSPDTLKSILDEAKGTKKGSSLDSLNLDEASLKDAVPVLLDVISEKMAAMQSDILGEVKASIQGVKKDRVGDVWDKFKSDHPNLDEKTLGEMADLMENRPGRSLGEYLNEVNRPGLEQEVADFKAKEQQQKEEAEAKSDVKNLPAISEDSVKELGDGKKTMHEVTGQIARELQAKVGQPNGE